MDTGRLRNPCRISGQLEILKLRQYAKDQLGDRFNLSNFHDEVLGAGALPLDVLSTRIHEWVGTQNAGLSAAASTATGN